MYELLNTHNKLTKKFLYYAEISTYNAYGSINHITVRKVMVRLDTIRYNPYKDEEVRQLTFQGFNLQIPFNECNQFSVILKGGNAIISTQKQEVARFLTTHFINPIERKQMPINTYKGDTLKLAINKLKKL